MGHIEKQQADGNGWPGGVRISWQALTLMLAVVLAVAALVNFIRASDLTMIDAKIGNVDQHAAATDRRQTEDYTRIERRLERIEQLIMAMKEPRP